MTKHCNQSLLFYYYYYIVLSCLVIYNVQASSSSSYSSIANLDKYGNCVQIKNARLSSLKYGTPIIAAISTTTTNKSGNMDDDKIVVCSIEPSTKYYNQLGRRIKKKNEGTPVIHFLTPPTSSSNVEGQVVVAMVTSGLQADGTFLISSLRRYGIRVWERFDKIPNCHRMAQACSQLFLTFMGYDVENEISDGIKEVIPSRDGENSFQMARPFGVSALLLGIHNNNHQKKNAAEIKFVEPSGIISDSVYARALGKESERANKLLKEKWKENMNIQQVKDMCISIMKEITHQGDVENKDENANDDEAPMLICEIIHGNGSHEIERIRLL